MRPSFKVGDKVFVADWDASEPPSKRLGRCWVTAVAEYAKTRILLTLRNAEGKEAQLDSEWVSSVEPF